MAGRKPLGHKAYGSIGHLPLSRLGPGDHKITDGQARICLEKTRDKRDTIRVSVKLDGSNCSVAKIDGQIVPLTRAGYRAETSPYEQHHLFAKWVAKRYALFDNLLLDRERVVGEWLLQAHGTRYHVENVEALFAPFDVMSEQTRVPSARAEEMCREQGLFFIPYNHVGEAIPVQGALDKLVDDMHTRWKLYPWKHLDPVEGLVYRVEREDPRRGLHSDFLAKYVFPNKRDGIYLPECEGAKVVEEVWNFERGEI